MNLQIVALIPASSLK